MVWLKLVLCLVIILFAGTKLARYGDAISEKTGLGRIWIGLVLVAFITAMPELVTSISSAALVKVPDLALGTLLGSCLFNLSIIGLLDILHRPAPVLNMVSSRHMALAGFEILLVAMAMVSIIIGGRFSGLSLGWVGIPSVIMLIVYLVGVRGIFCFERRRQLPPLQSAPLRYKEMQKGEVYLKFTLAAAAIIGAGIWLSFVGDEIARTTGWDASFIGSLFLAITTSMPELVVAIAALRLGAVDMAVADILGANMLDVANIIWSDLAFTQGPILANVSNAHIVTTALVILMSLILIIGIRFQEKRKTFIVISWYAIALIGLYLFGAYALFTAGFGLG